MSFRMTSLHLSFGLPIFRCPLTSICSVLITTSFFCLSPHASMNSLINLLVHVDWQLIGSCGLTTYWFVWIDNLLVCVDWQLIGSCGLTTYWFVWIDNLLVCVDWQLIGLCGLTTYWFVWIDNFLVHVDWQLIGSCGLTTYWFVCIDNLLIRVEWCLNLFDRYYDRYRDKKELAEEVMRIKMKMIHPFHERTQESQYPLIHRATSYKPTWLKKREELMVRRLEQFKDLPPQWRLLGDAWFSWDHVQ